MFSTLRRRRWVKWISTGFLIGGLSAATLADPPPDKPAGGRGEVIQRDYLFDAVTAKRLSYALFVPSGYDAAKPAPLIVLLHGWASNPWQVIHYQGILQEAEKRGYIVVAPYGYNAFGGYGNRGPGRDAKWLFQAGADMPADLNNRSEQDVFNVLAIVRKDYSVNPRRIYLMGHSMGGGGTLYLGMKYRGQWAALAALSPAIYSDPEELKTIRDTPIIVVQGERDFIVKADNTRRWVETMKQLRMDYLYVEIAGGDHLFSIARNPAMIAQVFDFFDAHPK